MITPSKLRDELVKLGYNEELSANALASQYLFNGFTFIKDENTRKDIQACLDKIKAEGE